ncbi:MAG TPA: lipocalin-like domain-containing protein [Rariglobus sp.]|jgi:predicted secreted hydrolase|nr:lipocalin-like domain-containing protein [Rariglobus sp.]
MNARTIPSLVSVCIFAVLARSQTPLTTADGFAVPQPGHVFSFPRDYGSHPDFKLEWWYLTGHLFEKDGRRFGYQATFFRSAAPDKSTQLYLAHMALVDVKTGKFYYQERLNREGWDASASTTILDVHNGPWSLRMTDPATAHMELNGGVQAEAAFALTLAPEKPLVIFGDGGVSRKGAESTAASYYLTFTRLRTAGTVTLGGSALEVTGESWMDHEISSSQLGAKQVGWDWLSIQFNDDREIMFYRLRLRDGTADPASSLTWVDAAGRTQKSDFKWEVIDSWKSPSTGAVYPSRVRLTTTDPATHHLASFTLEPLVQDQELAGRLGGIPYWEGACRVLDESGRAVGSAYLELTGYAKDLKL